MNRNLGVIATFGAKFPRHQTLPIAFAYVRKNGTGTVRDFTVTVKTADYEAVQAANGQDVADAYVFAQTVLQHTKDAIAANATKLNLNQSYRKVKVNQTTTRFHLTGYFSTGRAGEDGESTHVETTVETVAEPAVEAVQPETSELALAAE